MPLFFSVWMSPSSPPREILPPWGLAVTTEIRNEEPWSGVCESLTRALMAGKWLRRTSKLPQIQAPSTFLAGSLPWPLNCLSPPLAL